MSNSKQIFRKIGRVILYILLGVFTLILLSIIFINIPLGKKLVRNQVQSYLQNKLKTKVSIGRVDYSLPKWLEIKNVYIEDQKKDTLIYGQELRVDLSMFKLIQGNTDIQKILFKNILLKVNRGETDSFFNYKFLVDAFSGNKSTTINKDTAELKLTLDQLIFDNVGLKFNDRFGGTDFYANIQNLDVKMNKFQPDRTQFLIDKFYANGINFIMNTYKEPRAVEEQKKIDSVKQSSYGFFLTANKIDLRDINVLIENRITGLYSSNKIKHVSLASAYFDLNGSAGTADSLLLDSSSIVFTQPKRVIKKDSMVSATAPWLFQASSVRIAHSKIKYDDINKAPVQSSLDFSHLDVRDLYGTVDAFKYSADTTRANVSEFSFKDKSGFQLDTTRVNFLMTDTLLSASNLYIKTPHSFIQRSFQLTFDSLAAITTAPKNSHIAAVLSNSVIAFNDLYLLLPAIRKSLPPANFANQYLNLNTELRGNLARLYLPYLKLSGLSGTRLTGRGTLFNLTDPNRFGYDLYIDQSNVFKKDLLRFVPPANQQQLASLPDLINLQGHFVGDKNNLTANVNSSAKDFRYTGLIQLKNISDPIKLQYDATIGRLDLSKKFIAGFLPPALLKQLNLPERINASGKLNGNSNNITTNLKLGSSYGPLKVKGYIRNIKDTRNAVYDLFITTPGFALGHLIKQDSVLGNVAGTFTAKGAGFDYKTMRSAITAEVNSLHYNKYDYRNANIVARFNRGDIESTGSIKDSSIYLDYNLASNVSGQYPTLIGNVHIDTIQLKRLNLYDTTLNFSGDMAVNFKNLQPRHLDANMRVDSAWLQLGTQHFPLDTLSLIANSANGIDSIRFFAPFAEVTAGGAFDYDKVGISIERYVNNYYKIPGFTDTALVIPDQQLAFNGIIKQSPIVSGLIPGLGAYDNITFVGGFASANTDSALNFQVVIPLLNYQSNRMSKGAINISSRNEKLNYDLRFDTLKTSSHTFYATKLDGAAAHDSIALNAKTSDNHNVDWFGLSGEAYVKNEAYTFKMKDSLLLNYEKWNVAPDNYLSYSRQGIIVNNFLLKSDTSKIFVKSHQQIPNSPVDIDIDNFNLKSISSLVSGDTLFASGILDVDATVSDLQKPLPAFTGTAKITNLEILATPVGTLNATANKQSDNNITATVALLGPGNDLSAKGNYYLNNEQQQFDANLDVNKLNVQTLQGFSRGMLKNSTGNIHGSFTANGKFTDPRWKGELDFDTTSFTIAQLGAPYKINNQKILFQYPRISFPQFSITDSVKNPMKVNGYVDIKNMNDINLGLDINANNFIVVNAPKAISSQVYGYAAADINVSVSGTAAAPKIEGDISVNEKSNVFFVLPQKSYGKDEGKTIVRFIDRDTFDINPPVIPFVEAKSTGNSFARFLNYNLNIEITKEAALTVIVDPATGDEIKVQGDARLNAGVDPGGNIVLAGNYELNKGYYDLHYQFLERKFDLVKGSTIVFAGAPTEARIDITAAYTVNTSSKDLLGNEVTDLTSNASYNQKLPFKVILYLTGVLSKPIINFDIQLPDENTNLINSAIRSTIDNKLAQLRGDEAATNKQVFSLLLLNRFVGEQSSDFFKGNGGGFSDIARQSVSQFLSQALNQVAGDLIKGVNIDLNLSSYNDFSNGSGQQRTDLNVALSKNFLDNRLTVTVGTNFGVEGQDAASKASNSNTGFKPDVTLAYKLTPDGKYLLRAYTKNQFEATVDGYVVETGLAFVLTMDYEKFYELFSRKGKKKNRK